VAGRNKKSIDVYRHEGLTDETSSKMTHFSFCRRFAATFIANLNHLPQSNRDIELAEAHRCLNPPGKIIVTMGDSLAEWRCTGFVTW
jgi:hypothetical protein